MPVPLQHGGKSGYGAGQRGHHLLVPPLGRFTFFTAGLLGCFTLFAADTLRRCQVLPAEPFGFRSVAATVSAVKVMRKQLRHSEDGEHDGDVRRAFKVL